MTEPIDTNRVYLSFDNAVSMLPDGETVHTFRNGNGILFGCDWGRDEIIEAFKKYQPELSGETATGMGHGLVFIDNHGACFVETKEVQS